MIPSLRPVVVTGYGIVSHAGAGIDSAWDTLEAGARAGAEWTPGESSPPLFAAVPEDYRPHRDIPRNLVHFLDAGALYSVDASLQALAMAGLNTGAGDARRFGVADGQPYRAPGQPTVYVPYGQMAARILGIRGPVVTLAGAETSGMAAIAEGARLAAEDHADVVVAVASQALQPQLCDHLREQRWLAHGASRPFDASHEGMVPAEGAASIILEAEDHAMARGATVIARVESAATVFDPLVEPLDPPEAETAGRAMQAALSGAGYLQNQVDLLVSSADGRPRYDTAEAIGALRTFGRHAFFAGVTSAVGSFGDALAASGPMSVVAALESMRRQRVFPIGGFEKPLEQAELAFVREPRDERVDCVLVTSLGTGGIASALLLQRPGNRG